MDAKDLAILQMNARSRSQIKKNEEAAQFVQKDDEDHVLLMVTTNSEAAQINSSYLDSGCLNHEW